MFSSNWYNFKSSWRMRWEGKVICVRKLRNVGLYRVVVGNPEGNTPSDTKE
jgi:hypothetical protein